MREEAKPRPPLRFWDLALFGVATSLSIRWLASAATAGAAALPMWIAALVGFMAPLVIATAEMVGRFPGEGGLYDWTKSTLGPFPGFLTGWLYWTCNLPFFSGLLYFIVQVLSAATGPRGRFLAHDPAAFAAVATAIALAVWLVQAAGLGASKWLTNFGAAALAGLIGLLIAIGAVLALGGGGATDYAHASWAPPLTADGAALWATMAFAYGGPESLAFMRGEVKGGTKGVLKVLAVLGLLQTVGYIAGTMALLAIMPAAHASRLAGISDAFAVAFGRLGASRLTAPTLAFLALATLGGYAAWFVVAARLPFVVGADRYLPAAFARRHPKTGAPTAALAAQTVVVVALVWLGQAGASVKATYDFLVAMGVLSYTLPFLVLFAVYLLVQQREPPPGEWVMPGGRGVRLLVGAVGLAVTFTAVACTLVPSPEATDKLWAVAKIVIASGVLIGSGVLAYGLGVWRARAVRPAPALPRG